MEPTIIERLWAFTKAAFTKYSRQSLTGAGLVGCSMWPIFFNHIPVELRHTWIGVWALMKTVGSAYLGSMGAALGSYHVDKLKKKRNENPKKDKGKGRKAA